MLWAKLHVSCGERKISRVPSCCEMTVLSTALMQTCLGCREQSGCLTTHQKAAGKQKGVQERKQKCWQVDVPGEILG